MQTIPMMMQNLMLAANDRHVVMTPLEKYLSYPVMDEVPPAFNRLAYLDFAVLSESQPDLDWDDYCPAYALGLLAYDAYHTDSSPHTVEELQAQWDELRGSSKLEWDQVRAIIARSWNALTRLQY